MSDALSSPYPLVLASSSPRRREIVAALGAPFVIHAAGVDEAPLPGESAATAARRLAEDKALAAAADAPGRYVVGADTVVVLAGEILGKPADAAAATAMLRHLRGRRHDVVSGVAVVDRQSGRRFAGALATAVWMRHYRDAEIARYVGRGEPFDKAGAYAIQDRDFNPVGSIAGCYLNVVGLPLCLLLYLLALAGVALPPPSSALLQRLCPNCVLMSVTLH